MKRFSIIFSLAFFFFLIIAGTIFSGSFVVYAQAGDDFGLQPVGDSIAISASDTSDLRITVVRIINIFLGFLGVIGVSIVLYAGFVWMTAGGNEEKITTAKKLLINAGIGLAIIMSSFAITSFVLNRLQGAIDGSDSTSGGGAGGSGNGCQDPLGCFPPDQVCVDANFVVKSITPHAPTENDVTGMNNVVVRALFSNPVAGQPGEIFSISRTTELGSTDVSGEFTFSFDEDGSLVEAIPVAGTIPVGTYTVNIREGLRDRTGRELTTETACGIFATTAQFRTGNEPVSDTSFTGLDPVSINGYSGDGVHAVILGRTYSIRTALRDDHGNSYARIRVYKEGDTSAVTEFYLDGPRLSLGSSAPFEVVRGITILENRFEVGPVYVVEVVAHDIDTNTISDTVRFRVTPPTCLNGVLDPDEDEIDQGGMCGGGEGGSCETHADCSHWLKCLDASNNVCNGSTSCTCTATPYISKVEYMNGAPGNFITITGRNFGTTPGTIRFDYDHNQNGTIDSSVGAGLAQCREGGSWNDSWIIAEVPLPVEISTQEGGVSQLEILGGIKNNLELNGASSVSVSGNYAYVTAQQSGFLHIVNISNPANPQVVSKISIPGAYFVHTVGNYAYVVFGNGFGVVDVTDKTRPVVVGNLVNPQLFSIARGVAVSGNYAYVASEGTNSFFIIDVSNKTTPSVVGSITDDRLGAIRNVAVSGEYAYVTSYYTNSLHVIRISDKQNPVIVGSVKDDNTLFHISGIAVAGRYAYVTVFDRNSVAVIDVGNPVSPVIVGSLQDNTYFSGPFAISTFGTQGFVINRRGNSLAVVDFTNPQAPRIVGSVQNNVDLSQPFGVASVGKYVYVTNFSDRSFRIIDAGGIGTQFANNPAISVSDANGLSDSTNDLFGPLLGLFTYNTTQRPNLCSVTVANDRVVTLDDGRTVTSTKGSTAAPQGTTLSLEGAGFGTGQGDALFGQQNAPVSSWSTELVSADVPFGIEDRVPVYVTAQGGERSNPVPFMITSIDDLFPPVISKIEPSTTTKGSFITITGNRFGNDGTVYFTQNANTTCPGSGCFTAGELPLVCGDVWSDTSIVARVPNISEFTLGSYFVIVRRGDGVNALASSGKESVVIVDGAPAPSICRIEPTRGFAPFSDVSKPLKIIGENFVAGTTIDPVVRFWYPLAQAANPTTWLSLAYGEAYGGASIVSASANGQEIRTTIPYDPVTGYSMTTGPIKVENEAGVVSNGLDYTVLDCREDTGPKPGFHCCTEGPDQGRWKHGNFACQGIPREAGYVWRFTTGKMPRTFEVVESCKVGSVPTPSPSVMWDDPATTINEGKNQCVNSRLAITFNLPIDPSSVFFENAIRNVSIATCGGDENVINCANGSSDVTTQFVPTFSSDDTIFFDLRDSEQRLLPNTWYRVALSSDVTSLRGGTEFGQLVSNRDPLAKTKSCELGGREWAYCFDFRTGPADFMCTLTDALLNPSLRTTKFLGIVQDPRYGLNQDLNAVFNIDAVVPLTYTVVGTSNLLCTVINVDDKPWVWGPTTNAPATAAQKSGAPNSHGYATAWQYSPTGSDIEAQIIENDETIVATSTLVIDLGNPYAKSVWPLCLEACVNAEIGIEFSQYMNIGDFTPVNITLRKCADESCNPATLGPQLKLDINVGSQSASYFRAYPDVPLEKNSWYLVQMGSGIRSIGGVVSNNPEGVTEVRFGNSAESKQWKFKTKDSAQLCLADSVRVEPDPFTATFIGQAKIYRAQPIGSPDSCSPQGQLLNPWQFGWDWSVANQSVAKVSEFSFSGSPKNTCTIGCTPAGSDIARAIAPYPICGNGIVELGEDCDIARAGEIPGSSCNFSCLRPGNTSMGADGMRVPNTGTGLLQCGNGVVDVSVGEECDPASAPEGLSGFCSNTCLYTGSSQELTENTIIPVCMSGQVGYGEDCEIDNSNGTNYCSVQCLNRGTQLSQQWCDGYLRNPNDPRYQNVNRIQVQQVCGTALSVCGNGIIEQGEECEQDVDGKDTCSDRCLVQNACDTAAAQCQAGAPGCLSDCTFAGSSITYINPSVCADGITGIGEYRNFDDEVLSCESEPDDRRITLGDNPVQVVTSVGGVSDTGTEVVGLLQTEVVAQTSRFLESGLAATDITPVSGNADYYLRCGYTEYTENRGGIYNDCPSNPGNVLGVGRNSCCVERPIRVSEYPAANAGIAPGTAPVCRNTYVEVEFNQNIPIEYAQDNIELVQGYPQGYECSSHGGTNVTLAMNELLDRTTEVSESIWVRAWSHIKNFFARLIRVTVFASEPNQEVPADLVWCTANIPFELKASYSDDGSTRVSVYPTKLLDGDRYVSVLLNGGTEGIRNSLGVSIKSPFTSSLSDQWMFKTSEQVCKISHITVDPEESLYTIPNSSKDFIAYAISNFAEQKIVSVTGTYQWEWAWGPNNDQLFDIPATSTAYNRITSKGFKGHTDGVVTARVTVDTSTENNQQGRTHSSIISLDALFCQRPWPAGNVTLSEDVAFVDTLFRDTKYNFSFSYCADKGNPLTVTDDLPFFNSIEVVTDPAELGAISDMDMPDALRRYLFFSQTTNDVVGIQIFANPVARDGSRKTIEEWYTDRFGSTVGMTKTTVGGYPALISQTSVYVNAYNIEDDSIYNNIYLFTIDANAGGDTRAVFEQLLGSLVFNTNLTNFGRCLQEGNQYTVRDTPEAITNLACVTDFDCRNNDGFPKTGTNGICSNAATKFMRDIQRLEQLQSAQDRTDQQFN